MVEEQNSMPIEKSAQKKLKTSKSSAPIDRYAFSVKEVAVSLNCSERTVWREIHAGKLRHIRIARRVLITPQAMQEYLKQRLVKVS